MRNCRYCKEVYRDTITIETKEGTYFKSCYNCWEKYNPKSFANAEARRIALQNIKPISMTREQKIRWYENTPNFRHKAKELRGENFLIRWIKNL